MTSVQDRRVRCRLPCSGSARGAGRPPAIGSGRPQGVLRVKLKPRCCEKYARKAKACGGCPVIAVLSKSERRKKLRRAKKKLRRA